MRNTLEILLLYIIHFHKEIIISMNKIIFISYYQTPLYKVVHLYMRREGMVSQFITRMTTFIITKFKIADLGSPSNFQVKEKL